MKQFYKQFNLSKLYTSNSYIKNSLLKVNSFSFSSAADSLNKTKTKDINIKSEEKNYHYPIRGFPKFESGMYTVFSYKPEQDRLPLMPYEVKECAMKGFLYTLFLTWGGRMFSNAMATQLSYGVFLPYFTAGLFFYQYGKVIHYMANAITSIKLKENGTHVVFEFKNLRSPLEVEIWRISKKKDIETVIQESFAEPYLLPIEINYEDKFGKSSFRSTKTFFIYGDSHSCIRDGEILRAIINSQPIKLN